MQKTGPSVGQAPTPLFVTVARGDHCRVALLRQTLSGLSYLCSKSERLTRLELFGRFLLSSVGRSSPFDSVRASFCSGICQSCARKIGQKNYALVSSSENEELDPCLDARSISWQRHVRMQTDLDSAADFADPVTAAVRLLEPAPPKPMQPLKC